jgi:hypothetical protein
MTIMVDMIRSKEADLVVVVASLNVKPNSVEGMINNIFKITDNKGLNTRVVTTMHSGLDPKLTEQVSTRLKTSFPSKVSVEVVEGDYTFAYAYLKGLQVASEQGKNVIEIDSGGGHDPKQLPGFLDEFKNSDLIFSSRFLPGSINKYPWQRKISSWAVTQLSNTFLDTKLTDAASGYEGFSSKSLRQLFQAVPPEKWHSATKGPFHMYQTEMRAYMSWLAEEKEYKITEIPITYGVNKTGQPHALGYLARSLECFWDIWKEKNSIKKTLSNS